MKKLITLLIATISTFVLLFGLAQPVHATTEDDYYDLFYEEITVTFEILTYSSPNGTVTEGTYDQIINLAIIDDSDSIINIVHILKNDAEYTTSSVNIYSTPSQKVSLN